MTPVVAVAVAVAVVAAFVVAGFVADVVDVAVVCLCAVIFAAKQCLPVEKVRRSTKWRSKK